MRQPEGTIKDACRAIAKQYGLLFTQIEGKGTNGVWDTQAGHVDRQGIVLIEFKTPTGELSVQQERRGEEYRKAGQRHAVCRSVGDYRRAVGLL